MRAGLLLASLLVALFSYGLPGALPAARAGRSQEKSEKKKKKEKQQQDALDPVFEDLQEDDFPDLVPADESGEFMDVLPDEAEADFPDLVRVDEEGGVMDEFAFLGEEDVVYTASRHRQRIGYSPSTVLVITAEEIRASGATSLLELLRHHAAARVWEVDPIFQTVSFRGSYKSLLMVDGVVLNTEIVVGPFYPIIPKGLSEIERVEVVLGPNSALYGANAVSAVINLITRRAGKGPAADLRLAAGEHGTTVVDGFVEYGQDPWGARLSFGLDRMQHWMERDRIGRSVFRAAGRFDLDLLGGSLGLDAGIASMAGRPYIGIGNMDLDYFTNGHAKAEWKIGEFTARAYWYFIRSRLSVDFNLVHPETGLELVKPPTGDLGLDSLHAEAQYNLRPFEGNLLIAGADFWFTTGRSPRLIASGLNEYRLGAFLRDEQRLFERLELTAGARFDWNSITEAAFNPQAALVYNPAGDHFLRLSAGMGFRKPTLLETHAALDVEAHPSFPEIEDLLEGQGISNPGLHNEKVRSIELGYRGTFLEGDLQVCADAYYVENREQVIFSSDIRFLPPWNIQIDLDRSYVRYQNSPDGDHNVAGLHLALEGRPLPGVELFVRGEVRRAWYDGSSRRYRPVPGMLLASGAVLELPDGFRAGLTWVYVGRHFETLLDPVSLLLPTRFMEVPARSYLMGRLGHRLDLGPATVELGILAFNLLGGRFREYPGGPTSTGSNFAGQLLDRRILLTMRLLY